MKEHELWLSGFWFFHMCTIGAFTENSILLGIADAVACAICFFAWRVTRK